MKIKKIGKFLLDLIELYIPLVTFATMFVIFIVNIFYRYALNSPLTWPFELQRFTFIWTLLLGGCYARRKHSHISFSLVYDLLSKKKQLKIRIINNLIITFFFIFAIRPSYEYIKFMEFQKSTVLRIPYNIIFFPFIIFLVFTIGHSIYDVVIDFKKMKRSDFK